MEPTYFKTQAEFKRWLKANHAKATELWVGFFKKGSGKGGLTYQEALDEALCVGWIDGLRKGHDEESFKIRFSPRKARSLWSAINIRRVGELEKEGRLQKRGKEIFESRKEQTGYSIKNAPKEMPAELVKVFKKNKAAWKFFEAQPPGYRKLCGFWISFAKREETKLSRLQKIIEASERGVRLRGW